VVYGLQRGEASEVQSNLNGGADVGRAEMEDIAGLDQALMQPRDTLAELAFDWELSGGGLCFALGADGVELLAPAEHGLLDL
jgi:hypothetical protein